jgi:hypothetical protein
VQHQAGFSVGRELEHRVRIVGGKHIADPSQRCRDVLPERTVACRIDVRVCDRGLRIADCRLLAQHAERIGDNQSRLVGTDDAWIAAGREMTRNDRA